MTLTSDSTFEEKPRPFSDDFHQKLRNLASDVSAINQILPAIRRALLDQGVGVSQAGGANTFPALITGRVTPGHDGRKRYKISKVVDFDTTPENPKPVTEADELQGFAINLAELEGSDENPGSTALDLRGTGISENCGVAYTGGAYGTPNLSLSSLEGRYVNVTEHTSTITGARTYTFFCWVPFCITCPSGGQEPLPYAGGVKSEREFFSNLDMSDSRITEDIKTLARISHTDSWFLCPVMQHCFL